MEYPREAWIAKGIDPAALPDDLEVPDGVPGLFSTELPEGLRAFDQIRVSADGTDLDVKFIVLGAVEPQSSLLYVLDPASAEVLQFDPAAVAVRGVNSNYRWFVEFLRRIGAAVESASAADVRAVLNRGMRFTLRAVDERAFEEGAWWPKVFGTLGS
ncbi:SUKH-4 family immunity protein [Glycomyces arizonensis]|uniref:SUKH-4 family immunity protein n=1 Tax=Glycomyces arizonensis TaxID=256035 RepID=UPI00047D6B0D|nr:SUKH-4 family immunity protein [Glycomyces arizonensis]